MSCNEEEEREEGHTTALMPGSYHSPISGFLDLPESDQWNASHNYLRRGYAHSEDSQEENFEDLEEEEPISLEALGLRVGPFHQPESRLSKHTSTQTLKAGYSIEDIDTSDVESTWDSEAEGFRSEQTTANLLPAHNSNTRSASSSIAAPVISNALRIDEPKLPTANMSTSLPRFDLFPQEEVKESWDDDFLFQDKGESEEGGSSRPSLSRDGDRDIVTMTREWGDSEDDDEEDWSVSLSNEKEDHIPKSTSVRTIQMNDKSSNEIIFNHLERIVPTSPDQGRRSGNLQSKPPSLPTRMAEQSTSSSSRTANQLRSSLAAPLPSKEHSDAEGRKQESIIKTKPIQSQKTESSSSQSAFRGHTYDRPAGESSKSFSRIASDDRFTNSPHKLQTRQHSDGHWSRFLSSRMGQSKSPEVLLKGGQARQYEAEAQFIPQSAPLRSLSPPLSPSAARSRELSLPKVDLVEGETTNRRKGLHRRGATSLSMGFGISAPWARTHSSTGKRGNVVGSLSNATNSSVSLASITAETGRPENDFPIRTNQAEEKQSPTKYPPLIFSTRLPSADLTRRKVSWDSTREPSRLDTSLLEAEDKRQVRDASRLIEPSSRRPARQEILSPSSFREPPPMLGTRSRSGSISTANSAMTSSDYATSTGSMTEESTTLYELIGDATDSPSPSDFKRYPDYNRRASMGKSNQSELIESKRVGPPLRKVTSARRIRVSTSKAQTSDEKTCASEGEGKTKIVLPSRSAIEVAVRLPSDPLSSTSKASRELNRRNSSSIDSFARRNSLGDLRIPSRITKAQEGIKANMTKVKDFAMGIEELKMLREQYQHRLNELSITDAKRIEVEEEFDSWWECAEVLIGLGQGKGGKDDEVDVMSLDQIQTSPMSAPTSGFSTSALGDNPFRRSSWVSTSQSHTSMIRSATDVRPASSRASSSRSIDPQREIDILAAMLAGTPADDISPIRDATLIRERTMSAFETSSTIRAKPTSSSKRRQEEPQGQFKLANTSTTSLTFADVPPHPRSRSHQATPSVNRALHQKSDRRPIPYETSTSSLVPGQISTDSVNLQVNNKRLRLRSTGKAGLQGLKELLRTFKMSSTALPYQGEASQSRISLARTTTIESRASIENLSHAIAPIQSSEKMDKESDKSKRLSRSRSLFSKSMGRAASRSPTLQRNTVQVDGEDIHPSSRSSSGQESSLWTSGDRSASSQSLMRAARNSSGADSSAKDTSLDSDWTQGDFEYLGIEEVSPNSRPELSFDDLKPESVSKLSAGRKRFFLFSKGFPPSAARRHSRDILNWASNSRESIDMSPQRQSPKSASKQSRKRQPSPPGMPRATSTTLHPLLLTEERLVLNRRSVSTSSSSSLLSPSFNLQNNGREAAVRLSKASTAVTGNTVQTNSSEETQIASPTSENVHTKDKSVISTESSPQNFPSSCSPQTSNDMYRKFALKPEAIPSLLVYLETTKARCQESLSLLGSNSFSQTQS